MGKIKSVFSCVNCGEGYPKWSGKCPSCGEWNTLVEQEGESNISVTPAEFYKVRDLPTVKTVRIKSNITEFDRVLGGNDPGLVGGSVVLLAGSPGVGKSTLLLQLASSVKSAVYVSAEESLEQLRIRLHRLGLGAADFSLSADRDLSRILSAVMRAKPPLVIIDSIQTVFDETTPGTPGSIVQVKELCWRIQQFAHRENITFVIVGHVTKEGMIAGPKVLEHLVDVVLYLEGDKRTGLRILRADKNRFGATDEVGIWQLDATGFKTVPDPGKLFASLVGNDVPGRALTVALEGTRAFLVEIQALVTKTGFGYPKRASQGFDLNRLNLLLAVMESRLGLPVSNFDIYLNVVGGFTLKDPGVDLAVVAAIYSALTKKTLSEKMVLVGEVGLLGEVRPPTNESTRRKEIDRLHYQLYSLPKVISELAKFFTAKT